MNYLSNIKTITLAAMFASGLAHAAPATITHQTCAIDPTQVALNAGDITLSDGELRRILASKGYWVEPGYSSYGTGLKLSLKIHVEEKKTRGFILKKKIYSVSGERKLENLDTKDLTDFSASAQLADRQAALDSVVSQIEASLPDCRAVPLKHCKGLAGLTLDGYTWTKSILSSPSKDDWESSVFEGSIRLSKEFDVPAAPNSTEIDVRFDAKDFLDADPVISAKKSGPNTDTAFLVRALKSHLESLSRHSLYFSIDRTASQHTSFEMSYSALNMGAHSRNPVPAFQDHGSVAESICISPDQSPGCFGMTHVSSYFEVKCE